MSRNADTRSTRARLYYWATPVLSLVFGVLFLLALLAGGHRTAGAFALALMVVLAIASVVLGRYSETVRGLMDRRDERIVSIDQRAVNAAASMLLLVLIGSAVAELARGHSGTPFTWLAALYGLTYLATLLVLRLRG
jgi:hypothetical protein